MGNVIGNGIRDAWPVIPVDISGNYAPVSINPSGNFLPLTGGTLTGPLFISGTSLIITDGITNWTISVNAGILTINS